MCFWTMRILLIICVLVTTALQILFFAAAAATFLFVVIDVHCSVFIMWKVRKQETPEEEQEASSSHQQQSHFLPETSSSSSNTNDFLQKWRAANNFYRCDSSNDDGGCESALDNCFLSEDNHLHNIVGHSSKTNTNCYVDKRMSPRPQLPEDLPVSHRNSCSDTKEECVKWDGVDGDDALTAKDNKNGERNNNAVLCSPVGHNKTGFESSDDNIKPPSHPLLLLPFKDTNGDCLSAGTRHFQEMFPFGACIVVLAIYLITRRKFYLDATLLEPEPVQNAPNVSKSCQEACPTPPANEDESEASKTPSKTESEENNIKTELDSSFKVQSSSVSTPSSPSVKEEPPDGKSKDSTTSHQKVEKKRGKRKGGPSQKAPSVLERFSSVLNKAQQPKMSPLPHPHSNKSKESPQQSHQQQQQQQILQQNAINSAEIIAPAVPSKSVVPVPEDEVTESLDKKPKIEEEPVKIIENNKSEQRKGEVDIIEDNFSLISEDFPLSDGPAREPPVIELLDVLKGDTTSRLVRMTSGVVISKRYMIEKEIGRGGFSKVYLGTDLKLGQKVAIKTASRLLSQTKSLKRELAIYEDLQKSCSNLAIPYLLHYTETDIKRMAILIMDLLGPSLEDCFEASDSHFSMVTVSIIMDQLLGILRYIHAKTYVHRDIKPENVLIGRLGTPAASKIFLIDFGVVSNWANSVTGKHLRSEYGHAKMGTNSYMSINAHRGRTQSRKDDLEALGYCMIRFLKVNFPWSRYDDMPDGIKQVITLKMKTEMNFEEEFPISQYPEEISEYLQYVRDLGFETKPEYEMLKKKFRSLGERIKEEEGWDGLEWNKPEALNRLHEWILPD